MDRGEHWNDVYAARPADRHKWYAPRLERSLTMIRAVTHPSSEIIDVGGGASTLADDLLEIDCGRVTVLDLSDAALTIAKRRLGTRAQAVTWINNDVTEAALPDGRYDVWHDRAVFHFLTGAADRRAYTEIANRSIKQSGHMIIATFSLDGPTRCSGLDVVRYSAEALGHELGSGFILEQEVKECHVTPAGAGQEYLYCLFRKSQRYPGVGGRRSRGVAR